MASNKDYYKILGVTKNSSQDDIKKAYRKLAREHHPDMVNKSDKEQAEMRFKEISEAYQVLSDPQKRKMYDQYGTAQPGFNNGAGGFNGFNGFRGGSSGPFSYTYTTGSGGNDQGFGDFDPFDIFEEIFGFRGYNSRRPRRGKSLYYKLDISFKDAIFGLEKDINIESGKVKIKIPAGVRDGMEIKFAGKGMPGPSEGTAGDLFISLKVHVPDEFKIVGNNIFIRKEINLIQAVLGSVVEITVVDLKDKTGLGKTKLKIPQGTQYGQRFLVRGKGMPKLRSAGQGDILVEVFFDVPERLSRKQRKLYEELEKTL